MAYTVLKSVSLRSVCKYCQKFHGAYQKGTVQIRRPMSENACGKSEWQSVVGLEIHAQISSDSKLFSGASTKFGSLINNEVAFFDAALPGTLPVLNKRCVEAGVLTALALGCTINPVSKFDRKHYFYADLPAGYQITQQRKPLAYDGELKYVHIISGKGQTTTAILRTCGLIQLQLEQDSGKSLHDHQDSYSLIDLNRAGIGLMELVTHPDLKDGEDAASFVRELQQLLQTIGTCDGKMQEGSLRVDANVSVHKAGEPLGVRTEVKNIGSIRSVSKAVDFEILRQIKILENGGEVENETRSFDAESGETVQMRDKEKLLDYRFMPEPNLPPLRVYSHGDRLPGTDCSSAVVLEEVKKCLTELPGQIRDRVQQRYHTSLLQTYLLLQENLLDIFESLMVDRSHDPDDVYRFVLYDFLGALNEHDCSVTECPIGTESLRTVSDLTASGEISALTAKKLLSLLFEHPRLNILETVDKENWRQIRDKQFIRQVLTELLNTDPKLMRKFLKGGPKALKAIKGPVQRKLDQKADLNLVTEIAEDILKELQRRNSQ